jgi:hypothetical protein
MFSRSSSTSTNRPEAGTVAARARARAATVLSWALSAVAAAGVPHRFLEPAVRAGDAPGPAEVLIREPGPGRRLLRCDPLPSSVVAAATGQAVIKAPAAAAAGVIATRRNIQFLLVRSGARHDAPTLSRKPVAAVRRILPPEATSRHSPAHRREHPRSRRRLAGALPPTCQVGIRRRHRFSAEMTPMTTVGSCRFPMLMTKTTPTRRIQAPVVETVAGGSAEGSDVKSMPHGV